MKRNERIQTIELRQISRYALDTHDQIWTQMECNDRVLYDNGGPVNRQENTFYNCRECTAPTSWIFPIGE